MSLSTSRLSKRPSNTFVSRKDLKLSISSRKTGNFSPPKAIQPILEDEKTILMDMIAKNQELTNKMNKDFQVEKQEMIQRWNQKEANFQKEIKQLKLENQAFKKTFAQVDSNHLRVELLTELQRMEFAAADQASDHAYQIRNLNNKILLLNENLNKTKQKAHEDSTQLLQQLKTAQSEFRKLELDFQSYQQEMNIRLEEANKELSLKRDEQIRTVNQYEARFKNVLLQKFEGQDIWLHQKEKLISESTRNAQMLQRKQQKMLNQLSGFQTEKTNLEAFYLDKIHTSNFQVQQMKKLINQNQDYYQQVEKNLSSEVSRMRTNNIRLLQLSQQREFILEREIQSLKVQHSRLQDQAQQKSVQSIQFNTQHLSEVQQYQELLKTYHEKQVADAPANQALRLEISELSSQLKSNEIQLKNMRELYLESKTSDRRNITKALTTNQNLLDDINKQQRLLIKQELKYTATLRNLQQQNSATEVKLNKTIVDLTQRLEAVSNQLNTYKSQNSEQELIQTKKKNTILQHQLHLAQTSLNNHQTSIKNLQEIVYNKMEKTPEIRTLKLEINRLVQQNLALNQNKISIESFYQSENAANLKLLEKKTEELQALRKLSNTSQFGKAKRHLEQVTAWQHRHAAINKTLKTLQNQIKVLSNQAVAKKKLGDNATILQAEELHFLREEIDNNEKQVSELKQTWEQERKELKQEVERLRGVLLSTSEQEEQRIAQLDQEYSLLLNDKAKLAHVLSEINEKSLIPGDITPIHIREETRLNQTYSEIVNLAREEINALKQQLQKAVTLQKKETESLKTSHYTELEYYVSLEQALNKQIQSQKLEIKTLTANLEEDKTNHAKDLKELQKELQSLRRVSPKRHNLMIIQKQNLAKQINNLLNFLHEKDQSHLSQGIKNLQIFIRDKSRQLNDKISVFFNRNINTPKLLQSTQQAVQSNLSLISKELIKLKVVVEQNQKTEQNQKFQLQKVLTKLREAVQVVDETAKQDVTLIEADLQQTNRKLQRTLSKKKTLKSQRDNLLKTLDISKSISKLDSGAFDDILRTIKHPKT